MNPENRKLILQSFSGGAKEKPQNNFGFFDFSFSQSVPSKNLFSPVIVPNFFDMISTIMLPPPPDWPRISSALYYEDPAKAIDWLCDAFGFEVRLKIVGEDVTIVHSELSFAEGLIMVGHSGNSQKGPFRRSPKSIDGINTQNMMVYVDNADEHCQKARSAGAIIHKEPETVDYGPEYWSDRGYECEDLEGHRWWFYQRLRNPVDSTK